MADMLFGHEACFHVLPAGVLPLSCNAYSPSGPSIMAEPASLVLKATRHKLAAVILLADGIDPYLFSP